MTDEQYEREGQIVWQMICLTEAIQCGEHWSLLDEEEAEAEHARLCREYRELEQELNKLRGLED